MVPLSSGLVLRTGSLCHLMPWWLSEAPKHAVSLRDHCSPPGAVCEPGCPGKGGKEPPVAIPPSPPKLSCFYGRPSDKAMRGSFHRLTTVCLRLMLQKIQHFPKQTNIPSNLSFFVRSFRPSSETPLSDKHQSHRPQGRPDAVTAMFQ